MKAAKSIFIPILFVILSVMDIIGIVHSFNHHSKGDTALAFFVPPHGIYRGFESFSHK